MPDERLRAIEHEARFDPVARARLVAAWVRVGAIQLVRLARLRTNLCDLVAFPREDLVVTAAHFERPVNAWRLVEPSAGGLGKLERAGTLHREGQYGGFDAFCFSRGQEWLLTGSSAYGCRLLPAELDGVEARCGRGQRLVEPRGRPWVAAAADRFLASGVRAIPGVTPMGGLVRVWRFPARGERPGAPVHLDAYASAEVVHEATFSPDGEWVYASSFLYDSPGRPRAGGRVDAWGLRGPTAVRVARLRAPGPATTLAATADGRLLFAGSARRLVAWRLDGGRPLEPPCLDVATVASSLAVSPGGTWLVTSPASQVARGTSEDVVLWWLTDPSGGVVREVARFPGRGPLAFSPGGGRVACGGGPDGAEATVWRLSPVVESSGP